MSADVLSGTDKRARAAEMNTSAAHDAAVAANDARQLERARAIAPQMAGIQKLSISKAINLGLERALIDDPRVLLFGEDVAQLGGVFRVTDGLHRTFGQSRVFDTPLAEAGIVGTAVGLASRGYRPVVEIQFDGFIYPAYNQIITQLAKMNNRTDGHLPMPVVIRVPVGGGIGAVEHHSESPEAQFAHTAGLRIVCPSNAEDAYWMIQQAIRSQDPVLFFEPKRRYWDRAEVDLDAESAPHPLHAARVLRRGEHVTVACWGPMVATAMKAAGAAEKDGTSIEVVDMRSLAPLDMQPLIESVRRTGRLVVAHEAPVSGGLGGEIAARVGEECFYSLESPVLRVGGFSLPYPPARIEDEYLPDLDRLLDAVDSALEH